MMQGTTKGTQGSLNKTMITGFLLRDIGIGAKAEWGTPMNDVIVQFSEGSASSVADIITILSNTKPTGGGGLFNTLHGAINKAGLGEVQRRLQAKIQTIVTWTGTASPIMEFPIVIPALHYDQDIRKDARDLLKCVFPISEGSDFGMLKAPLYYQPGLVASYISGANTDVPTKAFFGTIQVWVGQWLRLANMVAVGVDVVFSREVTKNRTPLLALITLTVQPAMMWTAEDIDNIFPDVGFGEEGMHAETNAYTYGGTEQGF